MEIEGKTALLTGATGGLGRAIATGIAKAGGKLILSSRKADELIELADSLPGEGHRTVVADLAIEGAALRLLEDAGPVDILVANAGLPATGHFESFTQEQIDRALRVNLQSPIKMARQLMPGMIERDGGHLVFIASISGRAATARASIYAATKYGLRGFALCLREDARGTNVGVSVISPGAIADAGMFADSGAKAPALLGTGKPEQVADAVVRAIERNSGETTVAPLRQRALSMAAVIAPEISGKIAGNTAAKVADEVAAGQAEKR